MRSRIHHQMLRHLVRTANAAVKDAPALAGQFILPRTGAPHRYFLTAAKAMLGRAVEFQAVLLAHGLGATLIDELTRRWRSSTPPPAASTQPSRRPRR